LLVFATTKDYEIVFISVKKRISECSVKVYLSIFSPRKINSPP